MGGWKAIQRPVPGCPTVHPTVACLWTGGEESSHTSQAEIRGDGELFIFQHTKDKGHFLKCLPQALW